MLTMFIELWDEMSETLYKLVFLIFTAYLINDEIDPISVQAVSLQQFYLFTIFC